jgi:hypothetical protein
MSLQFWKPGTAGPGSTLDRATETEENVVQSAPSSAAYSIQNARERLPIFKHSASHVICSLGLEPSPLYRRETLVLHRKVWSHYRRRADGMRQNYPCVGFTVPS